MTLRNTSRQLTELQHAIMDFIWERGPSTADEIRVGLLPKHKLKDPTVRTLLRRLEERDYLTHKTDGKVFVYRTRVQPRKIAARNIKRIIAKFWSGSAEQFLVGLVDEKILSVEEIERLAKKIRETE